MRKLVQWLQFIISITVCVCSCNTSTSNKNSIKNQFDSLLGFEPITAIYSYGDRPFKIDTSLLENEPPKLLDADSIHKWTDSPRIIDSIKALFPKLIQYKGNIETTCCGQKELLICTDKQVYKLSWNNNTSDSAVYLNSIVYGSDKKELSKIYKMLDRTIIKKEIYLEDTLKYALDDIYNSTYLIQWPETRIIYILK